MTEQKDHFALWLTIAFVVCMALAVGGGLGLDALTENGHERADRKIAELSERIAELERVAP